MQYTIIRVYRVPGVSAQEAQERFIEAVEAGVERDFHVRDYTKESAHQTGPAQGDATRSWWALIRQQLLGR
ncbi:hypothetical protein [Streptomyces cinerochromogenes]|uniref:hypothetical protein n=1 Tax=Streptomyces cinerochromogenes TaxID=66422 RepID=UPI001670FC68|nr:hypothetical protein [Streptomyces cinerochromogenes]GGS82953.1 hypothetical protein GCM10010206_51910 [Streptomyces cinerochromogenes]